MQEGAFSPGASSENSAEQRRQSTVCGRIDKVLFELGLASSRSHAQRMISEQRVEVNGQVVNRVAQKVQVGDQIATLQIPTGGEYASRGAHKLLSAIAATKLEVAGKICLDAGASTGGFTDVLLRNNAKLVIAVDVGHGQLVPALAQDKRVINVEGQNIRELCAANLGEISATGISRVDALVSDLSFISLTTVMENLADVVKAGGELLLMVKPQFEVGKKQLPKSGVVSDKTQQLKAVENVIASAREHNLELRQVIPSGLTGQDGNQEYFLHLQKLDSR